MRLFCEKCGDEREVRIVQKPESYPVKGEDVTILANVCTCAECGTELLSIEHDDDNLRRAYAVYCERHHLLTPERIKAIRDRYGISQVSFARMLGVGDKTIARYENGSLQDESINNLILLAENPQNLKKLMERKLDTIPAADAERVRAACRAECVLLTSYSTSYPFSAKCSEENISLAGLSA